MNTNTDTKAPTPTLYRRPDVVATMQEEDEAEKVQAEQAETETVDALTQVPDDQLSAEERTYKKRYGDLRRHADKQARELNERIRNLERAVAEKANASPLQPPKTREEVQKWLDQFPDVGGIVKTIAQEEASALLTKAQEEIAELRRANILTSQEKAMAEVRAAHPDFDEITNSDEFHEWADSQSTTIQAMLFDNLDNAKDMISAIKLYKAENGISARQTKRKDTSREAATAVTPKATAADPSKSGKKIWKTSEIRKLRPNEFAKVEAELDLAKIEGRIQVDD